MSHIHAGAIAILTKELEVLEAQVKAVREDWPGWEGVPEVSQFVQEADWNIFDMKRSIISLKREAGIWT